jgi:hypothetical protein
MYGINNNFNPYNNITNPQMNNFQTPQNNLIRVTGLDGAKAYQMPPNSSVALFDNDNDIMYVKTTDGAGFPTVRIFKFEPLQKPKSTETDSYITRQEFEELKKEVEEYGKQFVQGKDESTK